MDNSTIRDYRRMKIEENIGMRSTVIVTIPGKTRSYKDLSNDEKKNIISIEIGDDILAEKKMTEKELLAIIERWKEERKEDK